MVPHFHARPGALHKNALFKTKIVSLRIRSCYLPCEENVCCRSLLERFRSSNIWSCTMAPPRTHVYKKENKNICIYSTCRNCSCMCMNSVLSQSLRKTCVAPIGKWSLVALTDASLYGYTTTKPSLLTDLK